MYRLCLRRTCLLYSFNACTRTLLLCDLKTQMERNFSKLRGEGEGVLGGEAGQFK